MTEHYIYPLATVSSLEQFGGKGMSLGYLATSGFPVPSGFHIATSAYQLFIESNDFREQLNDLVRPEVINGRISFDSASRQIQNLFDSGSIPDVVREEIKQTYGKLATPSVAVRSSATAEDQPDHSFAGLQDTYLNVKGPEPLFTAVQNCWASLWNPQALAYRHQMGITHEQIAMAVVVQEMMPAQVSGVLFTVNPATGDRDQMIVNASYGLGEAIVSGKVTPDSFIIDRASYAVKTSVIGAKEQMVIADEGQGTRFTAVEPEDRQRESLTTDELRQLHDLACEVESAFDAVPQDIEWLFSGGGLWLLQSRPITNLPPPPLTDVRWEAPEPSAFLARSQLVEHIPDPVSTLFEDMHMKISLQHYWGMNLVRNGGYQYVDTQPPACFIVQTTLNGYAYRRLGPPPRTGRLPVRNILRLPVSNTLRLPKILRSKRIQKVRAWLRIRWRMFRMWFLWVLKWRYISLPRYLREVRRWRALDLESATPEQLRTGIRTMSMADARYWYDGGVWNAFSLTRGTEFQLQNFLQEHSDGKFASGQFLSGLKSPAFEAHVTLWKIARQIRGVEHLYQAAVLASPSCLLDVLRAHPLGHSVCGQIDAYMEDYGHQIFTLDFAAPSEAENPENIARSLHALTLQENYNPISNQRELRKKRRATVREAGKHFRGKQWWQFRWLLWRARYYYPNREKSMFHLGEAWTVLRPMARELGKRLQEAGTLSKPDDIFFLNSEELGRSIRALLADDALPEYRQLTADRQQLQEARRRLTPPMHAGKVPVWLKGRISDDDGQETTSDVLEGSPVSPGQITAPVSLILSPSNFNDMKPGTILVCPTTTPAWTQLFPQAVGLVTDIGGILSHGSIVAREYGIPAVLGLGNATRRIADGQTITVDGTRGVVTL